MAALVWSFLLFITGVIALVQLPDTVMAKVWFICGVLLFFYHIIREIIKELKQTFFK